MKTRQYTTAMLIALIIGTATIQAQSARRNNNQNKQRHPNQGRLCIIHFINLYYCPKPKIVKHTTLQHKGGACLLPESVGSGIIMHHLSI